MKGLTIAELVENDCNLLAMLFREDIVQQRRFASTKISCDYSDRHFDGWIVLCLGQKLRNLFVLVVHNLYICVRLDKDGYLIV